jgi:hypothetical protein
VFVAAAAVAIMVTATAIAVTIFFFDFEGQMFTAVWAVDRAHIKDLTVNADFLMAVWAFYFIDFIAFEVFIVVFAAAVTTAAAIVVFIFVFVIIEVIFQVAEVFIQSFYFFVEFRSAVFKIEDGHSHIVQDVHDSLGNFALAGGFINAQTFYKAFQVSNFFC